MKMGISNFAAYICAIAAVAILLAFVLLLSCALPPAGQSVFTKSLLLRSGPGFNTWPEGAAGETANLPRPYKDHPPLIPHTAFDMTIDDCVMCHLVGYKAGKDHVATKMPPSHFLNALTGEKTVETPVGIRRDCLQCHVVQALENPPYEEGQK